MCCLFKKCRYPKKRSSRDDTVFTPAQKPLSNFIIKPGCFGMGSVEGIVFASAEMPLVYARVSPVSDVPCSYGIAHFRFWQKIA